MAGRLPTGWSCGGDSCVYCHRVRGAGGVRDIAVQRENRRKGGEEHRVVEGDVEEKKRNGSTNAGTCTSEVRAHRSADKKAEPPNQNKIFINIIWYYFTKIWKKDNEI